MTRDDTNSHILLISFACDGRQAVIPDGTSAAFFAVKPDNTEILNSCVCYGESGSSPNTVVYTVTADTVSAAGAVRARIILSGTDIGGADTLYSPCFELCVEENELLDSTYSSSSEYSELVTLASAASESAADAEAWAVGETDGSAVGSDDERYHNNAKYYAEQTAAALLLDSEMSAVSEKGVQNKVIKAYVDAAVSAAVTAALSEPT